MTIQKLCRCALMAIVALSACFTVGPISAVKAQGNISCDGAGYPESWSIGTPSSFVNGLDIVSDDPSAPAPLVGATDAGKRIDVQYTLPEGRQIYSVAAGWVTSEQVPGLITITSLYDDGALPTQLQQREQFTVFVNQTFGGTGRVLFAGQFAHRINVAFEIESTHVHEMRLFVGEICTILSVTLTPSQTRAPTLTDTPVPSLTPTPTQTLEPTDTPGPSPTAPTLTRTPTSLPSTTPIPSNTPLPTMDLFQDKSMFSTIPPPPDCTNATASCGVIPFPLPRLPSISIGSAVPYTQVAYAATGTLDSLTSITTGTPSGAEVNIGDFATKMIDAANTIIVTPGIYDADGNPTDLRNGANQIGQTIGGFFGTIRAIQQLFLGKIGTLIAVLIAIFLFILLARLIFFVLPIILAFFKFIIQIAAALMPF